MLHFLLLYHKFILLQISTLKYATVRPHAHTQATAAANCKRTERNMSHHSRKLHLSLLRV
jgi:hypothetical protein